MEYYIRFFFAINDLRMTSHFLDVPYAIYLTVVVKSGRLWGIREEHGV